MTDTTLTQSIKADLGANYVSTDSDLVDEIYAEVKEDALRVSNRLFKPDIEHQLDILASDIRRCVKTIYLQRGTEDVKTQSQSGLSSTYENAMERMRKDIISGGKRVML